MLHGSPVLTQSLNSTLEAFSFRDRSHIHLIADLKDICLYLCPYLIFRTVFKPELPDKLLGVNSGLLEMSHFRLIYSMSVCHGLVSSLVLGHNLFLLLSEADLNGFISIVFNCLKLCYDTGAGFQHRYRYKDAVFIKDLCHTYFFSKYRFLHFCFHPFSSVHPGHASEHYAAAHAQYALLINIISFLSFLCLCKRPQAFPALKAHQPSSAWVLSRL